MKAEVVKLQAAIFVPNLDLSNKIELSRLFIKETKSLLDGDPIILPVPPDAPPEVPRIILRSKEEDYTLNIGINRIDFYYAEKDRKDKSTMKDLSEFKKTLLDNLKLIANVVRNDIGAKVVRLGFIPEFRIKVQGQASKVLSTAYLKQNRITKKPYDLNLSILNKDKLDAYQVNIWFRAKSVREKESSLDNKFVIFGFDINTIPERLLDLQTQEIINFYDRSFYFVKNNFNNYINLAKK